MELRKDWSLAYFLLYLCQISYWLIVISVGIELVMSATQLSNEHIVLTDIPVNLELQQFDQYDDLEVAGVMLNISERMSSEMHLSGPYNKIKEAFFVFNGLKIYKNSIFFMLFFLLSRVLKNVAQGNPFHPNNSSYFSIIGLILSLSGGTNIAFQFLNAGHLISLPIINDIGLPEITSLNLFGKDFILAGIFFIVLGYVFKEGTRIYEEQKLTV